MLVRNDISEIFKFNEFTHSDGPYSPFNAGMFLLKPAIDTYNAIINRVYEGKFYDWKQSETHYAYQVTQGLLYYHFKLLNSLNYIDRGIYNFQVPDDIKRSSVQNNITNIKIVHFTGVGKPEIPYLQKQTQKRGICKIFHDEWTEIWYSLFPQRTF
jgi:hypothetical protein